MPFDPGTQRAKLDQMIKSGIKVPQPFDNARGEEAIPRFRFLAREVAPHDLPKSRADGSAACGDEGRNFRRLARVHSTAGFDPLGESRRRQGRPADPPKGRPNADTATLVRIATQLVRGFLPVLVILLQWVCGLHVGELPETNKAPASEKVLTFEVS